MRFNLNFTFFDSTIFLINEMSTKYSCLQFAGDEFVEMMQVVLLVIRLKLSSVSSILKKLDILRSKFFIVLFGQ